MQAAGYTERLFCFSAMTFASNDQDFSGSWDEFAAADAVSAGAGNQTPNDIMSWDKPPPIDESWGDPLGLKSKEAGAFVEKEADGVTSKSVASKYLESYMNGSDKARQADTANKAAAPQENSSAAESILTEKPKPESSTTSTAGSAIPVMAMAAGAAIGSKKPGSSGATPSASTAAFTPPTLDASWADELFKQQAARPSQEGPPGTGFSTSEVKTDGMDRSAWKWDLGGNNVGSYIRRGAAAIGVAPPSSAHQDKTIGRGDSEQTVEFGAYNQFMRDNPQATEAQAQAAVYGTLFNAAQQAGLDPSKYQVEVPAKTVQVLDGIETGEYRDVTVPANTAIDVDRLYADLDDRLKDVYLVGGMAQGLPGQTGNTGQKAVQAIYVRNGDKLVPTGTAKTYDAPENSHGFFGDAFDLTKEMAVDVMSDPVLATILGAVTAGASTSLSSGIGMATGMGTTGSNIAANALIRAGTAAVTGGNPLEAAAIGAITGGIAEFNPGAAIAPEAGTAAQRAINSAIGTTVTTGNPLAGLKTAGFGLAADAISPSITEAIGDATGIDPKNASAIANWAMKNAPALLQGRNLTPGQVMSLISASTPKREKA